jgi:hypothetical protein
MPRRPKASSTLFTIAWRAWEIAKPILLLFPAPVTQAISLCYAIYPWRFPYFDSLPIFKILDSYTIILRSCQDTNTNAIDIVTSHCEPEALHRPEPLRFGAPHGVQGEGRGNLTPSQPSGRERVGGLRHPAKRGTPRMTLLFYRYLGIVLLILQPIVRPESCLELTHQIKRDDGASG